MECLVFSKIKGQAPVSRSVIEQTIFFVLKKEKSPGSMSVHLIGDSAMKKMNQIHRGKNKTTDVLSFAATEGHWPGKTESELGDIFISVPQIKRQAKIWEVTAKEEFLRMLIHGTLHILGYDHVEEAEAKIMFGKQEKYLGALL